MNPDGGGSVGRPRDLVEVAPDTYAPPPPMPEVPVMLCPHKGCGFRMLGPCASARFCPHDAERLVEVIYEAKRVGSFLVSKSGDASEAAEPVIRQGGKPGWGG